MSRENYAATARCTVKLVAGTAIIETVEISCEHLHATVAEAATCAHALNKELPLYPYWGVERIEEIAAEVVCFVELSDDEKVQARDAWAKLYGWNIRHRPQRRRLPRAA